MLVVALGTADPSDAGQPVAPLGGVLSNRDFVKLWAGETVSLIGTQVSQFALPLVAVITLNATVFEVGVLNALRFGCGTCGRFFASVDFRQ